jgi:3-hydroxybutyryl-CoA dehydrogenase
MREERIAVLGAGTMGAGIAALAALRGYPVRLYDAFPAALASGRLRIEGMLREAVRRGQLAEAEMPSVLGRIDASDSIARSVRDAAWIVEAVPEQVELKREVLAEAARCAPDGATLATNTSSLSVTEITAACPDPSRALGMHFFNPPLAMPLIEIVRGTRTAEATIERARALAAELGKEVIVVRDSPGFATSRLGIALANEAMRMLEAGVASAAEIDRAMELGYRHPMGPLRLTDLVGLDVRLTITEHLHRALGSEVFRAPEILVSMVRAGKLGRKSGEGFYRWDDREGA